MFSKYNFLLLILSHFTYLHLIHANCNIVLDLGIMLDVSASIGREVYEKTTEILLKIVDRINTLNKISLSLVSFSNSPARINSIIDSETEKNNFKSKIKQSVLFLNQQTQTGLAIFQIKSLFNTYKDPVAPRIVIIFTDGLIPPNERMDFKIQVNALKASNVQVFAVGITNQINLENLKLMASNPSESHVLLIDDYQLIFEKINDKIVNLCNKNAFRFIQNYQE